MKTRINNTLGRLGRLWGYYTPSIRRQSLLTAGITLVCYLITVLSARGGDAIGFYTLATLICICTYYMGPLLFATGRSRALEAQLPATPGERTMFALGYCYVYIPALMAAVWYGSYAIARLTGLIEDDPECAIMQRIFEEAHLSDSSILQIKKLSFVNISQNMLTTSVCLYFSTKARNNAVLMGIVSAVCAMMALGFIGGAAGFIKGMTDATVGNCHNPEEIVESMMQFVARLQYAISALGCVCVVLFTWLLYRQYKYRQI
ncbi:MAG: hypothetical protein J6L73_03265 [Muribaculaceae bacterium]|nr:hypothetical protein [Muribaculaceae bacterium]